MKYLVYLIVVALACAGCGGVREPVVAEGISFARVGEPVDVADGPPREVIALKEAVRLALAHDPGIQGALARVRQATADARQARLLPNPIFNVAFRFPEGGGTVNVETSLSADLLALLQTARRVDAADYRLRQAAADALTVVLDTIAAVEECHATVRALDAEVVVLNERLRVMSRLVELARSRVEAGEGSRLDLLALDGERVAVEAERIEVLGRRTRQRLTLARMIGRPSGEVGWELPAWEARPALAGSERELIERALENRPEVMSAQWQLAALGESAQMTKLAWLDGAQVGMDAERDPNWSLGPAASVPVPLFDMGQAKKEKAEAQLIEARHRMTEVRRSAVEEVRQAVAALEAARGAEEKMGRELVPVARRRQEQAEAQYKAGEADVTTLLQAEQQLLAARSKLVQAEQGVAIATVRLRRAVGGARNES